MSEVAQQHNPPGSFFRPNQTASVYTAVPSLELVSGHPSLGSLKPPLLLPTLIPRATDLLPLMMQGVASETDRGALLACARLCMSRTLFLTYSGVADVWNRDEMRCYAAELVKQSTQLVRASGGIGTGPLRLLEPAP